MRRIAAWRWSSALVTLTLLMGLTTWVAATARAQDAPPPPPTVVSDKADYAPGEQVVLTGTGWTVDLPVNVVVNDDPSLNLGVDTRWRLDSSVTGDPVAATDGSVTYSFRLPDWVIATYLVSATQMQPDGSALTASTTFTDSPGAYSLKWTAADPAIDKGPYLPTYPKVGPEQLACPTPSGSGGRAGDPLADAVAYAAPAIPSNEDAVTSLAPKHMALGQVVPFEMQVGVTGGVTPENGTITFTNDWLARTTSGQDFGFDPAFLLYCAFVDTTDPGTTDPEGDAAVSTYSATVEGSGTNNERIQGTTTLTGLDNGDRVVVELWVVLKRTIPEGATGNVQTSLVSAYAGTPAKQTAINTGNQTVPLLRVQEFFSGDADLSVTKSDQPDPVPANGTASYTVSVTNNSPDTVANGVAVSDTLDPATVLMSATPQQGTCTATTGGFACDLGALSPGQTVTITVAVMVTEAAPNNDTSPTDPEAGNAGTTCTTSPHDLCNLVSVTAITTDPDTSDNDYAQPTNVVPATQTAADLTVTKTAVPSYVRNWTWEVVKTVDANRFRVPQGTPAVPNYTIEVTRTGVDSAFLVSGEITVANPNPFDVALTGVSDTTLGRNCALGDVPASVPANSGGNDPVADPVVVTYTCPLDEVPTGEGVNSATVTWQQETVVGDTTFRTPTDTATATAAYDFADAEVTQTNTSVWLDDPNAPAGTGLPMEVTEPTTITYATSLTGEAGTCTDYPNTATIYADPERTTAVDDDSAAVEVCVGVDLTLTKTAAGTYRREYLWSISKNVDRTRATIAAGDSAPFRYTVDVRQTGVTDDGWTLAGTITVANPNDWQDIAADVTDAVDNGGTCTVTADVPVTVPRSGSVELPYECTYPDRPGSYSGTNTATATWDEDAAATPSGSASGSAAFTLTQVGATNQTVHVTDTFAGDLGAVTATDSEPFATATFTYDRTLAGTPGTCTDHDNTATIVETGQQASQTVTVCVGLDLTVTKTAAGSFDRTYLWKIDKAVDRTRATIAETGTATFHYTVTAAPDGYTDSGWGLSGEITVTNPNDWQDVTADVTDAFDGGGTCTVTAGEDVVIGKGASVTLPYTCTFAGQPGYTGTNTATATWDKDAASTPTGTASGSADVTLGLRGQTNRTVTVVDDKTDPANPVTLGTADYYAGPFAFTYALDRQGTPGTCTDVTNTAWIDETDQSDSQTVTICVGRDLTVTKTGAGSFDRTYLWRIDKAVDRTRATIAETGTATFHYTVTAAQTGFSDSGWTLSGTITVANPNDWQDVTADVTDSVDNGGTCTVVGDASVTVPAGGSTTLDYTCAYPLPPTSYTGTNTATATWDKDAASTPNGTAAGTAGFTLTQAGSTNRTVHVTDTHAGDLGTVTATDVAPFATAAFTYTRTESGVSGTCTWYDNTATITETGQQDDQTVTVCVGRDLTVTKTAAGSFDRTYLWRIDKRANRTAIQLPVGGSAQVDYEVGVDQTGFVDSDWTASGTITVANPNDWQAVTADVADSVDNGGTCTVVGEASVTVPAGESTTLHYTCAYPSPPTSYTGTNTATATWDATAASTPTGTAAGTAGFTLTQAGSTNRTVHVTDTHAGDLGTVTATDAEPWASTTFEYSRSLDAPDVGCQAYDNTATIVETGQSDSVTVTVCLTGLVTDSMLCTFDVNGDPLDGRQFRRLFTPDAKLGANVYRLTATNPGQYYMNGFFLATGEEQTFTFTIPDPFVTQGATPIHLYTGFSTAVQPDGSTCILPGTEVGHDTDQMTLTDRTAPSVTLPAGLVEAGVPVYVNIHLDFGLKGTTGWTRGTTSPTGGITAVAATGTAYGDLPDPQRYPFSVTDGTDAGDDTVVGTNAFKKNPGVGGLIARTLAEQGIEMVPGATVRVYNGSKLLGTATTDADGWYMWSYKYTGKPVTFTVKVPAYGLSQSLTMKANGFLQADFTM